MTETLATTELAAEATAALRRLVGDPAAEFRDGQLEAVTALVQDRRRVLVVQRTGWGKSAVYFVTSALLRARGAGPDAARLPAARSHAQPDRSRSTAVGCARSR